jgi:hypothetical protein
LAHFGKTFRYPQLKFPQIGESKINGKSSLIMKLDNNFDAVLKGREKTDWEAFQVDVDNFLGRH